MSSEPETLPGSAVDVVVGLLFELGDQSDDSDPLDDRICEAICRLTSLERAVLLVYDPGRRLVVPAGSHGVAPEILAHVYGSLEETPASELYVTGRQNPPNSPYIALRATGDPSALAHGARSG